MARGTGKARGSPNSSRCSTFVPVEKDLSSRAFSAVTVVNRGHLARADVLFASLARLHPKAPRMALLIDRWPENHPVPEHFEVVTLEELAPPSLWQRLFGYTRFERVVTWKSLALQLALRRYPTCPSALYLDADMETLSPLDSLVDALGQSAVLLTPHLLTPRPEARYGEFCRSGIFNSGCLGVSAERGGSFLDWWESRLQRHCRLEPSAGLCAEQRWLDQVPALFEDAVICRHPGVNVAYWNLDERPLAGSLEAPRCAEASLQLFHYSGWSPHQPQQLSVHLGGRFRPPSGSLLHDLLERYHRQVASSPYAALEGQPSSLDFDFAGIEIDPADSLLFGDLLRARLGEELNPYEGLPQMWERGCARALFWAFRKLPFASANPREAPLYRSLCRWSENRYARRGARPSK